MSTIQIKRVYEEASAADGKRILVDRIWPRGLTKEKAAVQVWLKEIAPSHELRKWFHYESASFEAFREAYEAELRTDERRKLLEQIRNWSDAETVTLLFSAKDAEKNQAVILRDAVLRLGR